LKTIGISAFNNDSTSPLVVDERIVARRKGRKLPARNMKENSKKEIK